MLSLIAITIIHVEIHLVDVLKENIVGGKKDLIFLFY